MHYVYVSMCCALHTQDMFLECTYLFDEDGTQVRKLATTHLRVHTTRS